MEKFKNKYRIASHRKPNWDYSADALYFLTIITQHRECNLGEIVKTKLVNGQSVETHGQFVETHGQSVETHGQSVETHGQSVETHGQSVETHGQSVETHGRVSLHFEMILSNFGKIVEQEWFQSFEIRKELILHNFVLMPNHLHAIVEIYNENREKSACDFTALEAHGQSVETHGQSVETHGQSVETHGQSVEAHGQSVETHGQSVETHGQSVETHGRVSQTSNPNETIEPIVTELSPIKQNPPIRLPKSISSFIAGFKSAINTKIDDYIDEHQLDIPKYNKNNHFFQPNYHDHIIRNQLEYQTISNYIIKNPMNWNKDKFYV